MTLDGLLERMKAGGEQLGNLQGNLSRPFALDEGQNHYSLTKIFQIREKVWKDKSK